MLHDVVGMSSDRWTSEGDVCLCTSAVRREEGRERKTHVCKETKGREGERDKRGELQLKPLNKRVRGRNNEDRK